MKGHILFDRSGKPYGADRILHAIERFRSSYRRTVQRVIEGTKEDLSHHLFSFNAALVLSRFGMTRGGAFQGVKTANGMCNDPKERVEACWQVIGERAVGLRRRLHTFAEHQSRARLLVEMPEADFETTVNELWSMFKDILPLCMGKKSLGMVGASKVLFSVFPMSHSLWTMQHGTLYFRP